MNEKPHNKRMDYASKLEENIRYFEGESNEVKDEISYWIMSELKYKEVVRIKVEIIK